MRIAVVVLACMSLVYARLAEAQTCRFAAGALPAETVGSRPHGTAIPIDHVVVLMQENRSFDHYFGQLHFQGQTHARPEPRGAR
jgi:phospholipase C